MSRRPVVDLAHMHTVYERERDEMASANDEGATATIRAVAKVEHNTRIGIRVGRFTFQSDEPIERGGEGAAPTPLQYFAAGIASCLLTQLVRFSPQFNVQIDAAETDVRFVIDKREKFGLHGSGSAAQYVEVRIDVHSPSDPEHIQQLIAHAEHSCHAEQSLIQPIEVKSVATVHGS
ncbi:MAG: OsmC-related (seleno)protein [Acidimicrobiales bacterium]